MTNRFMITVAAAALLAGTGLATAQNPPSSSSTPERSERAAPSGGAVNRSDDANRGTADRDAAACYAAHRE